MQIYDGFNFQWCIIPSLELEKDLNYLDDELNKFSQGKPTNAEKKGRPKMLSTYIILSHDEDSLQARLFSPLQQQQHFVLD